ncbi:MAG TPA: RNA polymerase sigma-54 factor, partial [Candidatus Latescibacteria bacterium]|nr:RNA polymerase sigma-54 factor [Candidatus Latescibacterota bacterium]
MRQELRLQQRLAPQLIQSLHLLQLPALDLEQVVREELETNPLLEEVPAGELEHGKEEPAGETGEEADATSDIDLDATEWSDYLSDSYELSQTFREEPDHSAETYEPVSVYQETLADDLREQLRFVLSDETELKIGEYIIGNLDSNGFLATTVEEIAATLGVPAAQVQKVLKAVQTLDPP